MSPGLRGVDNFSSVDWTESQALRLPDDFRGCRSAETPEILARHHRRAVEEFIESMLDELDLDGAGDLEQNVVEVALRREVETGLVPGQAAIQAVFRAADAEVLGRKLPEWLERVSSVIPAESEFLTVMGRQVDPVGYKFLDENLGLLAGGYEVRRVFEAYNAGAPPL